MLENARRFVKPQSRYIKVKFINLDLTKNIKHTKKIFLIIAYALAFWIC